MLVAHTTIGKQFTMRFTCATVVVLVVACLSGWLGYHLQPFCPPYDDFNVLKKTHEAEMERLDEECDRQISECDAEIGELAKTVWTFRVHGERGCWSKLDYCISDMKYKRELAERDAFYRYHEHMRRLLESFDQVMQTLNTGVRVTDVSLDLNDDGNWNAHMFVFVRNDKEYTWHVELTDKYVNTTLVSMRSEIA